MSLASSAAAFQPLPTQVEARVAHQPDAIALRTSAPPLTYVRLNDLANRLSHRLRASGAARSDVVAVCVPRTEWLPVALLGVFKTAVYVPLDPDHPDARLAHILGDTKARHIVTTTQLATRFANAKADLTLLDGPAGLATMRPTPNPVRQPAPDDLAYLMYTSGSTGRPKAVEVTHGAFAARYACSPYRRFLGAGDVLAAITTVSWNPSVFESLFTLATGATIALADAALIQDPRQLAKFLDDQSVTYIRGVPSLFGALLDSGWTGHPNLTVITHGEALSRTLAERLRHCGRRLLNTYGATEGTVFSEVVTDPDGTSTIASGPFGTGHVHLIDDDGRPVGVGDTGDVALSGPILARGYRNDDEATRRVFAEIPATAKTAGLRVYRSGDRGRMGADGRIALLGRRDRQVKIRGQRIELAEVETALAMHADVAECAVVVRPDDQGQPQLVAFIVPTTPGSTVTLKTLRATLAQTLTSAMLPTAVVTLEALPLTAHGKLDRTALSAMPARPAAPMAATARPDTPTKETVVTWLSDLLGVAQVGCDDDFFALGGHSLLAVRLAHRVFQTWDVELPIARFFEGATARTLAAAIDQLRADAPTKRLPLVPSHAPRIGAPLSFAQERLWFLAQLDPGDPAYHLPKAWRLQGSLNIEALHEAITALVARHETLRTTFSPAADGTPTQTVVPSEAVAVHLPLVDLSAAPSATREATLQARLLRDARQTLDLTHAPLLAVTLYRLASDAHVLFMTTHHIVSDGWSEVRFRDELATTYTAIVTARPSPLAPLPIQALDHAVWQRASLDPQRRDHELAYWKHQLDGVPPLSLPTDHARPNAGARLHRGGQVRRPLQPSLVQALRRLGSTHDASLFVVLLAAFHALRFRYTGQRDGVVGSPVSGRDRPEVADLIGFFVNTLAMRVEVDEDAPFSRLLADTRQTVLDALAHQQVPFEHVVSALNPTRTPGRHPLIQVALAYQDTARTPALWDDLSCAPVDIGVHGSRLDLELHLWPAGDALTCHLHYDAEIFDRWRMTALLGHFETLLKGIAAASETPVRTLPMLSAAELRQQTVDWNATATPISADVLLHACIERQVARSPQSLALAAGEIRWRYADLDRDATALSARLARAGITTEDRVGVCLPGSPRLVIAELAVLKAGGAYVPLDPTHPPRRLHQMVEDAGISIVLTDATVALKWPPTTRCIDIDAPTSRSATADLPVTPQSPNQLAYVIFTSGSTGRPRGVAVEHRSVVNVVRWLVATLALAPEDRLSAVAGPGFDATVIEFWPALTAGASLHWPAEETRQVPARLLRWLDREQITVAFLPTPLFEACLALGFPATTQLRAVYVGGAALTRRPPAHAPFRVYNLYGPTEATVCATYAPVEPEAPGLPERPTIGRPIANTRVYVLDEAMNVVPVGVPGALWVGGVGVARGYLGHPDDPRFVTGHPLDARLYGTGDRVRYEPDGNLAFIGRVDAQISLRGLRVEPGEINAALRGCDAVQDAFTVAHDDGSGGPRLVSYVTPTRSDAALETLLEAEFLSQWEILYEETYDEAPAVDPTFDIRGWQSSLTGVALGAEEMREWVALSVSRVLASRPKTVLEIGCGAGLLLFPLAQHVQRYVGSDVSARAITRLSEVVGSADLPANVSLITAPAHNAAALGPDARYDAVVLNSVVQYFPSARYLAEVLSAAVAKVNDGGVVYVGDVRDLDLAADFYRAVEHRRGGVQSDAAVLRGRLADRAWEDKELLVSADFFRSLAETLPGVASVDVTPRGGRYDNEMARFRFDAILHVAAVATDADPVETSVSGLFGAASDPLHRLRTVALQGSLRSRLAETLPDAMIPAVVVTVSAFPLTRNGKVDPTALPSPPGRRRVADTSGEAPSTPLEVAVSEVMAEALGGGDVALDDNFFACGGHSLMAVRVVMQLEARLAVTLPLAAVFEAPTARTLAVRVQEMQAHAGSPTKGGPGITAPVPDEASWLPLTPMDVHFHYGKILLDAGDEAFAQVMELTTAPLDVPRLARAVLDAVNTHPIARAALSSKTALGVRARWLVGQRLREAPLTVRTVTDDTAADTVRDAVMANPGAMDEAPQFRFSLLQCGTHDRLLVRYNHGAVDAAGLQCLLDTVMARYVSAPDPGVRTVPLSTEELLAHYGYRRRSPLASQEVAMWLPRWLAKRVDKDWPRRTRSETPRWWRPDERVPASIRPDGGARRQRGYGRAEVHFAVTASNALVGAARGASTTLDRLFIVGLTEGALQWNREHKKEGRQRGTLHTYWAVNLRPPALATQIVANHFAWARLHSPAPHRIDAWRSRMLDPAADFLLQGALDWLSFVDQFHRSPLPDAVRRTLGKTLSGLVAPSMLVSNTLTFSASARGPHADAFGLRRMQLHSPTGVTNRPAITIAWDGTQLVLRMVYPRTLFDAAGATRFLETLRAITIETSTRSG